MTRLILIMLLPDYLTVNCLLLTNITNFIKVVSKKYTNELVVTEWMW